MAVHGCINQNFMDDDDDDGPVIFRRSNTTSKQIQVSSTSRNISSQRQERTPAKPVSDRSSHLQNSRPATSAKVVSRGSVATNKSSSVSTSGAPKRTPVQSKSTDKSHRDAGAYLDDSDDYKPLALRHSAPGQAKSSMLSGMPADESDDSDDDKPLNLRIPPNGLGTQKSNVLPAKRPLNSSSTTSTPSRKMSEAGKPFSSKLSLKSNPTKSTKKLSDSDDEKPLSSNFKQNGICKRDPVSSGMVNKDSNKRPLGDIQSSVQPNKKIKLSGSSDLPKMKQETSVKKELNVSDVDDEDHVPIGQRLKKTLPPNHQSVPKKTINKGVSIPFKKGSNSTRNDLKNAKFSKSMKTPPGSGEGQKWTTLEHNGVIFPPPYKPHGVKMLYNGQPVDLTPELEEVATMFAVMKDTDYATKPTFINNFMNDWRTLLGKNHVIKKFELCDFTPIYEWHLKEKDKKKQMSTEEKKALREEKLKQEEKYMWAIVDGVKEKVGNFRVEPPGLFRGRGEHPKMGKLKKRILPRDITINIGRDAPIPECPIPGERWKEIRHDNSVTWLAYWNDPINSREFKYVFLAASSSLKGQSDKEKYEKARKLKVFIHNIRENYTRDFTSKDETKRQIAVATYLIDKLALRAGNEKDDDEADTVGCCTLKVENVTLVPPNKLQFDFLGKDSIRYFNTVEVELPVYKAIGGFRTGGKKGSDDLFDKLDTAKLNAHLKELMPGLTAKVFRTYNASITLDKMLSQDKEDGTLPERIAVYQHANKEVAIICNHQRSVSKSHEAQMSKLDQKIEELKAQQQELQVDLSRAKKGKPPLKDSEGRTKRNLSTEALEKKLAQIDAKIEKMELDKKIKDDLKTVALGTSKINYLDPRISVAWCKRQEVPIEKIFNKSLLAKFSWAMDTEPDYRF